MALGVLRVAASSNTTLNLSSQDADKLLLRYPQARNRLRAALPFDALMQACAAIEV